MAKIQPCAFPRKLLWLVRYLGWFHALKICAAKPLDLLAKRFTKSEWFWRFVESQFDSKYGVETFEMVPVAELDVSDELKKGAVHNEPTPMMDFGYVLSRSSVSYSDFAFVDIGSGKGRPLLLAAWFPFKRIVGVEISQKMHQIAESNVSRYQGPRKCSDITSVCEDAGECGFPSGPTIIFLFNPFQENVFKQFLQNLRQSFLEDPREIILIYGSPKHRKVIESEEWLVPAGSELDDWYLIYKTNATALHPLPTLTPLGLL